MTIDPKEIRKLTETISKKYGEDTVITPGRKIDFISTGSYRLDEAIGIGGLPRGRVCDLYGRESAGKSMIAMSVVAQTQKLGGFAAYIDAEAAVDERWAKILGVDFSQDRFIRLTPETGEQAFDLAELWIKNGADLVVIDSTAALIPQMYMERSMEDGRVIGQQAALISQGLQRLTGVVKRSNALALFIGQVRKNINSNPYAHQEEESPTGGLALNFYSSVRIHVKRGAPIKEGDTIIGHEIKCALKKNKVAPPGRKAEFNIYYDRGIDTDGEIFDVAIARGIIEAPPEGGQTYRYGETKWRGVAAAREALKTDAVLRQEIADKITKVAHSNGSEQVAN